jgi:hypothetical protein
MIAYVMLSSFCAISCVSLETVDFSETHIALVGKALEKAAAAHFLTSAFII